jgi:hypothetical protein
LWLSQYQGLCPGTGGHTPHRPSADLPRQLRLHNVSACCASVGSVCSLRQHLAAVRLRVYNLLIKQSIVDRRERSPSRMSGVMPAVCEDGVTQRPVRGPVRSCDVDAGFMLLQVHGWAWVWRGGDSSGVSCAGSARTPPRRAGPGSPSRRDPAAAAPAPQPGQCHIVPGCRHPPRRDT